MKELSTIVALVLLVIIMFITSSCEHRSQSVNLRPVAYYKGYVILDIKMAFKDGNTMVIANDSVYKTIKPTDFEASHYNVGDTIK